MAESKLSLIQKENRCNIIHNLPAIFDKSCKGYKERDAATNVKKEMENSLEFIHDGMYYIIYITV